MRRGSILPMAVIMMSGFLVIAVEFAMFTMSGVRQARLADTATRAYYSAESGLESGLYQIRKEGVTDALERTSSDDTAGASTADIGWDLSGVDNPLTTQCADQTPTRGFFNDCVDEVKYGLLPKEQSLEFALYENDGAGPMTSNVVEAIKLEWTDTDCETSPAPQDPTFEVMTTSWSSGAAGWGGAEIAQNFYTNITGNELVLSSVSGAVPQVVRIKNHHCDLRGVTVTMYGADSLAGGAIPIPNYYLFQPLATVATGGGDVVQRTQVTMPRKRPQSDLFDYVVFTEEPLGK